MESQREARRNEADLHAFQVQQPVTMGKDGLPGSSLGGVAEC